MSIEITEEMVEAALLRFTAIEGEAPLKAMRAALTAVAPLIQAKVPDVVGEVLAELSAAMAKFPTWPTDPLHASGVVAEEAGELFKAVLQQVYEPHKNKPGDVRKEAIQTAAMAIRFIASMDAYQFKPGAQHEQPSLAAAPEVKSKVPDEYVFVPCHLCNSTRVAMAEEPDHG
jgi:hypothetical protein